ncbi:MAG TPA: histidine phosphatase family protein [Polyangiaceae bacterium]|nr:histidine phosphatase family protein [Polyangiaceae bacterium]
MRTLLVLRHGKAVRDTSELSDHARPLKKKGVREAEVVGQYLRANGLLPDHVLCSTAERARDTAQRALRAAELEPPIEYLNELYLAEPPAYVEALRRHAADAERALVVGHNPGLEALVYLLTGEERVLDTGALVVCELPIDAFGELPAAGRGTSVRELPSRIGKVVGFFQPQED